MLRKFRKHRSPLGIAILKPNPMRNSIAHGRRNAVRIVFFQLGIAGLVGLGFCARDWPSGIAAGYGGAAVAIGNALFAWRFYAGGVVSARRAAVSMFVAEAAKWGWLVLMLYLALAVFHLAPLPLIVGVIAAQVAFWAATGIVR
ncbi:MAG: ATP synthase subunit I [Rudaea sp.]|uniref:ATP synthase subunit I n=1 Tax=Rudaea sp. TaxID=2136325 RepID=UPI0039E4F6D1